MSGRGYLIELNLKKMYTPVSMKLSWKTAKQSPIYTRNLPVLNEKIKPLWTGTWEEKKMYWREDLKVNYKIELNKKKIYQFYNTFHWDH